tara:strand:- start:153762 stop:154976 length:1215 start_codon:yes stop_codon:yes gene_type:complete
MNTKAKESGKTVIIGLTGRVDSAVAAFLLQKQGFNVIGLSIIGSNPDLVDKPEQLPKCHIDNLEKVKEFCDKIGIPFYATNTVSRFNSEVIDKLVSNKILGQANSSCFNCTRTRFNILLEKMHTLKADYIASGHFAKVHKNHSTGESFIYPNQDIGSDQSFLLAGLNHEVLDHLLLPLGELRKAEVEKIAKKFNLITTESKNQTGFCFRSKESAKKILDTNVPKSLKRSGVVENTINDTTIGEHESMIFHYIGEVEPSFKDSSHVDKNLQITNFDFKSSTIYLGHEEDVTFEGTQLYDMHFAKHFDISKPLACFVKFKYSNAFIRVDLYFKNNNSSMVDFHSKVYPLIPGEVLVFYDKNTTNAKIIGWGLVGKRGEFKIMNRVADFEAQRDEEEAVKPHNYWKF